MSFVRVLCVVMLSAMMMPLAALAEPDKMSEKPSDNAPVTRAELPELVKQAILNNPDIIMQAAQKLRDKQVADNQKQAKDGIVKHKTDLFKDDKSPAVGSKNPDVTVVEFFDYHCGYCKHMLPAISQLVKDDKKVRVIFKEFPILSEDSVVAARAALAVYHIAPDKYFDFYTALMKSSGKFDEKSILDNAKRVGIDPDQLKSEIAKTDITTELDKNRAIAEDMGIRGTPALIVNNHFVPGALSYEELKKEISDVRSGKKSSLLEPNG